MTCQAMSKWTSEFLDGNVTSLVYDFVFQHLVERSWYAVTETCLAFTVFRDDFSPKFLALFTLLLFLKSFHWLAEERVDDVSYLYFYFYYRVNASLWKGVQCEL